MDSDRRDWATSSLVVRQAYAQLWHDMERACAGRGPMTPAEVLSRHRLVWPSLARLRGEAP